MRVVLAGALDDRAIGDLRRQLTSSNGDRGEVVLRIELATRLTTPFVEALVAEAARLVRARRQLVIEGHPTVLRRLLDLGLADALRVERGG